jgi:hypothetical protein
LPPPPVKVKNCDPNCKASVYLGIAGNKIVGLGMFFATGIAQNYEEALTFCQQSYWDLQACAEAECKRLGFTGIEIPPGSAQYCQNPPVQISTGEYMATQLVDFLCK